MPYPAFMGLFFTGHSEHLAHRFWDAFLSENSESLRRAIEAAREEEVLSRRDLQALERLQKDQARYQKEASSMPFTLREETETEIQLRTIELARRLFGFIPVELVSPRVRPLLTKAQLSAIETQDVAPVPVDVLTLEAKAAEQAEKRLEPPPAPSLAPPLSPMPDVASPPVLEEAKPPEIPPPEAQQPAPVKPLTTEPPSPEPEPE